MRSKFSQPAGNRFTPKARELIGIVRHIKVRVHALNGVTVHLQPPFAPPPPAPAQRACLQQNNKPHELKKQQNKSMAISTIKMTPITMPAMAPDPSALVVPCASGPTVNYKKRKKKS